MYLIKTPQFFKWIFPHVTWRIREKEKIIYITFDDGPCPDSTEFILTCLREYRARATFFCLGKNVRDYPGLYRKIIDDGHSVGNHTFSHKNCWKTTNKAYIDDIVDAGKYIDSRLFRPPYGKLTRFISKALREELGFSVIMWDVLSADFDTSISAEKCYDNVVKNVRPGSIIVFHDSKKAWPLVKETFPKILKHFSEMGYAFKAIEANKKGQG